MVIYYFVERIWIIPVTPKITPPLIKDRGSTPIRKFREETARQIILRVRLYKVIIIRDIIRP